MIYFYNKENNVLFSIEDFSDNKDFKEYVESMSKDGYELISKKQHDRITDSNLKMVSTVSWEHNDKFISKRKQAINDSKKSGWSDAMIEQAFGKAE